MSLRTYPVITSPIPFPASQTYSSELTIVTFQQYKLPGIFLHIHKYTYFYKTGLNGNCYTNFILLIYHYIETSSCINSYSDSFFLLTVLYSIMMLYRNLCNLFLIVIHLGCLCFLVSNHATIKIFVLVTLSRCWRILAEVELLGQRTYSFYTSLGIKNLPF